MMLDEDNKASWKSVAWRVACWGCGCGIGLGLVLVLANYLENQPKQREKNALIAKKVSVLGAYGENSTSTDAPWIKKYDILFIINVDLENRTSEDVNLPDDMTVMNTDKVTGALSSSDIAGPKSAFLPTHHTTSVQLSGGKFCYSDEPPLGTKIDECFDKVLKHYDLTLFDKNGNYEIKIPIPNNLSSF
jgi:hypothetical protein